MKKENTQPTIVDHETAWQIELKPKLKHLKTAWDKDGNVITGRTEYLESLPTDENGEPIVDRREFDEMAQHLGWDYEWLEEAVCMGVIVAEQFDEYYSIDY